MSTILPANPPGPNDDLLDKVQGDIWSKGFPKYHEAYYFFSIAEDKAKAKEFAQCLRALASAREPQLLSTLRKVKKEQAEISAEKAKASTESREPKVLPMANALIAFTMKGLKAIQNGLPATTKLRLENLQKTDPAFYKGMSSEEVRNALNDPAIGTLEPLFRKPDEIHGLLKVAGSSKEEVNKHLNLIQGVLKRGTLIRDVQGEQPSDAVGGSRVDGWTRTDGNRGKEHFGFEDGISQPLMAGIDDPPAVPKESIVMSMDTDPKILIVMQGTKVEDTGFPRPAWMNNGSFLVFRKLEQNVKAFDLLTDQWSTYKCEGKEHMGAKLMGRWQSGAPLAMTAFHTKDAKDKEAAKLMNNFRYENDPIPVCPIASHIRKTNPRDIDMSDTNLQEQRGPRARIIRNGIPYGPDYKKDEADGLQRGLLFACYQSHIEDGFQFIQQKWSNDLTFGSKFDGGLKGNFGLDPIIGQVKGVNGEVNTYITSSTENKIPVTIKPQLVTLKGGGYFFVPSIDQLKEGGDLTKT